MRRPKPDEADRGKPAAGADAHPGDAGTESTETPPGGAQEALPVDVGEAPAGESPPAGAEASAAELKDRWLRAEAELQNFRRRAAREWDEVRRGAEERVMLEMISALDDLERALESAREAGAPESWTAGVRLTAQRLREFLARQGVVTLEPLGQKFDPAFHEAMLEIDAPEGRTAGDVVQVVLKGYARGGRALRPARVVVARSPAPARGGSDRNG